MASADDLKGCKISLTTNSEVRYEGVLHDVDYEKSTLTVANVRSLGTEDRKTASGAVIPASDQVYDFIVFQAVMISNLSVVTAPILSDPAIITASPGKPIPAEPAAVEQHAPAQHHHQQQPQQHHQQSSYYGASYRQNQGSGYRHNDDNGSGSHRSQGSTWHNTRRQQHLEPSSQSIPQALAFDPKVDFDFETSNAQLAGMIGKMQLTPQTQPVPSATTASANITTTTTTNTATATNSDSFYDPSSSFFDNISCDSLDRKNGVTGQRKTRQEEQSLNAQTFGAEGATYRSAHGRRGGRGGRGRGGQQNQGRGGGSSQYRSGSYARGGSTSASN